MQFREVRIDRVKKQKIEILMRENAIIDKKIMNVAPKIDNK